MIEDVNSEYSKADVEKELEVVRFLADLSSKQKQLASPIQPPRPIEPSLQECKEITTALC
jgi:hypothetical protein